GRACRGGALRPGRTAACRAHLQQLVPRRTRREGGARSRGAAPAVHTRTGRRQRSGPDVIGRRQVVLLPALLFLRNWDAAPRSPATICAIKSSRGSARRSMRAAPSGAAQDSKIATEGTEKAVTEAQ